MAIATEIARAHQAHREDLAAATAAVGVALWEQVDTDDIETSWLQRLGRLWSILTGAQLRAASRANEYASRVLDAQGAVISPLAEVRPEAFVGIASDGRPLASLLQRPVVSAKIALYRGESVPRAMASGRATLDMILRTQVEDAGRVADGVATAVRPGVGYTRMVNPPSCSRCLLLAGRVYRYSSGFLRHPRCDCVHVPVKGAKAAESGGLVTNPLDYFNSLSREQQDKVFTAAGARAIRDGADISQVVNARRGLTAAGRTTEGVSRRGFAGSRLQGRARLMPEEIYRQARGREEVLALLRLHGYII